MVKHIMKDGRVLDSIEGIVIPTEGETEAVYRIIVDFHKNKRKSGGNEDVQKKLQKEAASGY